MALIERKSGMVVIGRWGNGEVLVRKYKLPVGR